MLIRRALFLLILAVLVFVPARAGAAGIANLAAEKPLQNPIVPAAIGPVGIGIKIANETGLYEVSPAVAYNSTRSEYLVVWYDDRSQNDDIWGQRLTKAGLPIGLRFPIASTAGIDRRFPRLAFNMFSDQYLVVWEQSSSLGSSVCGRRVAGDGLVLDTYDIVFEGIGEPTYSVYTPAVASTTSNKYLVVWSELWHASSYTTINGQVVLNTGDFSGGRIPISPGSGLSPATIPDLAYNPLKNEYLVVWQQKDPTELGSISDVWGRIVTGDGGFTTPGKIPIALYNKSVEYPAIAYLPVQPDGQYFVAWALYYKDTAGGTPDHDIVGRTFSSAGAGLSGDLYISNNYEIDETMPAIVGNAARGQYLVTWKQVFYFYGFPFYFIGGRLVAPSGSLVGEPFNMGGVFANHPRVAAGPLGDFLTVVDDTPLFIPDVGIYGQLAGNRTYVPLMKK